MLCHLLCTGAFNHTRTASCLAPEENWKTVNKTHQYSVLLRCIKSKLILFTAWTTILKHYLGVSNYKFIYLYYTTTSPPPPTTTTTTTTTTTGDSLISTFITRPNVSDILYIQQQQQGLPLPCLMMVFLVDSDCVQWK